MVMDGVIPAGLCVAKHGAKGRGLLAASDLAVRKDSTAYGIGEIPNRKAPQAAEPS